MKRNVLVVIFFLLFISLSSTSLFAGTLEKRWGIGLGNPYFSLKYRPGEKFALEGRGAFGSGISVYSARVYWNFGSGNKTVTFIGGEAGIISFDKEDIDGNGWLGMAFVGFERFITKSLTFSLDIGPAYISLSSEDTSVGGIEWVYNLGINFYFK